MKKNECIEIDGVKLRYTSVGKGMPILFLHGWGVDRAIWENRIEPALGNKARSYRRIYPDLPGMGKSITNGRIRTSDDMVAILESFIDRVIGTERFLIAGESYGGYLARGMLPARERQIDGAMFLCPLVIPGYRTGRHAEHTVLESDEKFLASIPEDRLAGFKYLSIAQTKEAYRDYVRDINLTVTPGNEGFLANTLDGAFRDDINANPYIFEKPTLVLAGRQDTEVGFEDQYDLFRKFPRASIIILDKAGHNLQIEQKGIFAASLREWLDRVETAKARN